MNRQNNKIRFFVTSCFLILLFQLSIIAGTGDGSVLSITKILNNGPDNKKFNIIIMGDGYKTSEIATFETHAQRVVTAFNNLIGFGPCINAVNFYRVNIESTDSGIDKPSGCYSPEVLKNTYLDTHYCSSGTKRCIWSSNTALVQATATSATSNWNFIVVLVNEAEYGGCSGGNTTFNCTSGNFERVVMHELGHAIGKLADEYEEFTNTYSGGEPTEANVTISTNRSNLKWGDLVLATTPIPTWEKTNCSTPNSPPGTWNGIVGTYEGGRRNYTCGLYRPSPNCLMRNLSFDFCAVCVRRIQQVLMPYFTGQNLSITPWGYNLNPKSSPYWQSRDIWCDNNSNGMQESDEPSIGKADNHLFARINNKGDVASAPYQVRFSYVPYTGVIDMSNEQVIHTINRPALAAHGVDVVDVLWDLTSVPAAFSGVDHFCVIVKIISTECMTFDNMAQNNFASVPTSGPSPAPVSMYIKNILNKNATGEIMIEPQLHSWEFTANVPNLKSIPLKPKEEKLITINFQYFDKNKESSENLSSDIKIRSGIIAKENFDITFKLNGQVLGGVSSEIIVHEKRYKFSLSFHAGKTFPIGSYNDLYDGDIMFGFDLGYRLKPQWSLVGFLGYNKFKSAISGVGGTYWVNLSANLKYEFNTGTTRPFVNFGPGLYLSKSGSVKTGLNLGGGVDVYLSPSLTAETAADYHHIFVTGKDVAFITAHVGFIYRF